MKIRFRLLGWLALAVGAGMISSVIAQPDRFAEVKIEATQIKPGIYMLTGAGGNIGASVGDDGILIIDDQFAPLATKIQATLNELAKGKPTWILNTHWHGDHTGGNAVFAEDGHVIAHHNVRKRLASGLKWSNGREAAPAEDEALPVLTFNDELTLHFNNQTIEAFHLPHAHTDGDTVVRFVEQDVLHLGDLFFANRFPFVDTESGGSVAGLIKAIDFLLGESSDSTQIIPGHGPLSKKADLARYLEMLIETKEMVSKAKADGMALQDVLKQGLGEKYASWGSGFISTEIWITTLYQSL